MIHHKRSQGGLNVIQKALAQKIVAEVRKLIDEDIVIMNMEGTIIASSDPSRIGHLHEGSLLTMQKKQTLMMTKLDEKKLKGVKAGINLPIFLHKHIIGVIGITGDPKKIAPYGELLKKMTELMIKESYYIEEKERRARNLESFVFDWLELREWDDSFIHRADLLGIDTNVPRQAALLAGQTDGLYPLIHRFDLQHSSDVIVRWGHHRFLLLLTATDKGNIEHRIIEWKEKIENLLHTPVRIGVGSVVAPTHLKHSLRQATRALKAAQSETDIVFDEELTLEMIIDDLRKETKQELIKRTIKPILHEKELLETLSAFFTHNQSLKETAKSLHIHINTLHYRLKKINELTALHPRQTKSLVILYLSLLFLDKEPKES